MNTLATIPQKQKTGFDLQVNNVQDAMSLATMIAKSQLAPKAFANKPEDTLVAMMMGNEIGLNPMQSIQNIAVINGRPSIWGDAMLALVQNHPKFGSIEETFDPSTMTATCTVVRKGGKPHTQTYSQEDAKKAGLWGKQGPWQQHPKRMIQMRARGFALRNQFADALLGLITAEEAQDYPMDTHTGEIIQDSTVVSQQPKKPAELPEYTDEQFKLNFPTWQKAVIEGSTKPERIINMIATKYKLSEKQLEMIRGMHVPDQQETAEQQQAPEQQAPQSTGNDDWFDGYENG